MSKKFDTDAYVSRWDNILIPVMLIVIFGSMIAVYALNVWAKPDCITHDYVFCGTPLDMPSDEGGHGGAGDHGSSHGESHGEGHGHGGHGDSHGAPAGDGHGHPH